MLATGVVVNVLPNMSVIAMFSFSVLVKNFVPNFVP